MSCERACPETANFFKSLGAFFKLSTSPFDNIINASIYSCSVSTPKLDSPSASCPHKLGRSANHNRTPTPKKAPLPEIERDCGLKEKGMRNSVWPRQTFEREYRHAPRKERIQSPFGYASCHLPAKRIRFAASRPMRLAPPPYSINYWNDLRSRCHSTW